MTNLETLRTVGRFLPAILFFLTATAADPALAQEDRDQFEAVVDVTRILTEVRVVDREGMPVLGLKPEDFRVKVDGRKTSVESLTWVPSTTDEAARSAAVEAPVDEVTGTAAELEGRLIVFVLQKEVAPRHARITGLMQTVPHVQSFIRTFGRRDRVALFVFGSHLELRSDFTADHEAVAGMVATTEVMSGSIGAPDPDGPSLVPHLDPEEMRKTASMSRALEIIGLALQEIQGTKSLIFIGFGLGRMSAGPQVTVGDQYRRSMEALTAARTSVFAIDITEADWHSLQLGMQIVSEDTGGFYRKTYVFPETAIRMLAQVISSYYELSIIPPPDLGESYAIKVKVNRPGTEVHVRQWHPSSYRW